MAAPETMKNWAKMSTLYKNKKDGCSRSDEEMSKNEYFLQKHEGLLLQKRWKREQEWVLLRKTWRMAGPEAMKKLAKMSTFYKNIKDGCSRSDEKGSKNDYFLQKRERWLLRKRWRRKQKWVLFTKTCRTAAPQAMKKWAKMIIL